MRPGAAGDVGIAALPALAPVGGAVEAAVVGSGFDGGVYDVAVGARHVDADLAHVAIGKPGGDFTPGAAAVRGLVNARAGAAGQQRPDAAPPLVGGRVHDVGVDGVELDVGHAGVSVDGQDGLPAVAAIFRPVEPALTAGRPERAFGGDEHRVPVARVDQDLADVLRGCEAGLVPGAAAVAAHVHAVAPGHVAPAHILSRAHPHNVRIGRVDRDGADRVGRLIVKDGRPRYARVRGLPDAAGTDRDVPGGGVAWVDRDVGDAAAHERRTDFAEGEALGGLRDEGDVGLHGLGGRPVWCGGERGSRDEGGDGRQGRVVEHGSRRGAGHGCGLVCRVTCGGGTGRRVGWKWTARGWWPQGGGWLPASRLDRRHDDESFDGGVRVAAPLAP